MALLSPSACQVASDTDLGVAARSQDPLVAANADRFSRPNAGSLSRTPGDAARGQRLRISTNQSRIERLRTERFDLAAIDDNLERVLAALPDRVKVYPSENYYYFQLIDQGSEIWGNIRLDSLDRKNGIVSFAYYQVIPNKEHYYNYDKVWHKNFSKKDGLSLEKRNRLTYAVEYRSKTTVFELYDLPQTMAETTRLAPDEEFVMRTFDESGFQLYLVFDHYTKGFLWILDESQPLPDKLHPYGKDIFVGRLSEFAFYSQKELNRKVLFGVAKRNIKRNNYYDGPFDQLADNFVDAKKLEKLIVKAYPYYKGKVRGRGDFVDKKGNRLPTRTRVSISPYRNFGPLRDLWDFYVSCEKKFPEESRFFAACLTRNQRYRGQEAAAAKTQKN